MDSPRTNHDSHARWLWLALLLLVLASGCSGLFQNLGAKWVTRQIATEFDLDEAQTAQTRASVERLIAGAPAALSSKVEMLVATVDAAISRGFTEQKLIGMEKQVDKLLDVVAGAIIDEASPILASMRDDQLDFAEARMNERLEDAREELEAPREERLEKRADSFVEAVEDWAGEISEAQKRSLRTFVGKLPDEAQARLAADERRLERVGAVLRQHPGSEVVRDALWREWKNREDWGPDARPPAARRAEGRQAILFVYGLFTPEQKVHASEHLHELHGKLKSFFGAVGS